MWDSVTVVTKPSSLPVTLSTAKKWLRVDHADDDTIIDHAIKSAVASIDGPQGIGLALMSQTWRRSMPAFCDRIRLPGWPVKSVSAITYLDTAGVRQTVDSGDYVVDIDNDAAVVFPAWGLSWPVARSQIGSVRVDYLVGEVAAADVRPNLISAVLMLASHRYEHREAVGSEAMVEIPLGVRSILDEFRRSYAV